jgi:hypothetical protein
MLAYANPENTADERQRADGHGLVRFRRSTGTATLECWPRFSQVQDGDAAQFPGWPVTIRMDQNDGRIPVGWLPELQFQNADQAVVQVVSETDSQVLYTLRVTGTMFRPPVFAPGTYTIRVGRDRPDLCQWTEQSIATSGERLRVQLP